MQQYSSKKVYLSNLSSFQDNKNGQICTSFALLKNKILLVLEGEAPTRQNPAWSPAPDLR